MKWIILYRFEKDVKFKSIVDNAMKNGIKLKHFDRLGRKSFWGGYYEKDSGIWVGQNKLGEIMESTYYIKLMNSDNWTPLISVYSTFLEELRNPFSEDANKPLSFKNSKSFAYSHRNHIQNHTPSQEPHSHYEDPCNRI